MKESEARIKFCPHVPGQVDNPMPGYCWGNDCQMWEPIFERENIIDKEGVDPPPGDGWQKRNERVVRHINKDDTIHCNWFRWAESDSGDCGLKSKELECGGG